MARRLLAVVVAVLHRPNALPTRRNIRGATLSTMLGHRSRAAVALAALAPLAGCASASAPPAARVAVTVPPAHPGPNCAPVADATLVSVARRIYGQAQHGRNATGSIRRLQQSPALVQAMARGDAAATRTALAPLIRHQIVRLELWHGSRRLVTYGTEPALAPHAGVLRDASGATVGRFVLAVNGDRAFAALTSGLTGAAVTLRPPGSVVRSGSPPAGGRTMAFAGSAFPNGAMRVTLALPRIPNSVCGTSAAATRAGAIGMVGRNLLQAESAGAQVARTVKRVAGDAAFKRAVAASDPAAVRAAIVGFFRDSNFHIVRVRAWNTSRLLFDLGGPYVLAPAAGTLRAPSGQPFGRFLVSLQDDTGYIKLAHRFTGAAVVLRTAAGTVPGSAALPGLPVLPARGTVLDRGVHYQVVSFNGPAFPTGTLRISLLVRG